MDDLFLKVMAFRDLEFDRESNFEVDDSGVVVDQPITNVNVEAPQPMTTRRMSIASRGLLLIPAPARDPELDTPAQNPELDTPRARRGPALQAEEAEEAAGAVGGEPEDLPAVLDLRVECRRTPRNSPVKPGPGPVHPTPVTTPVTTPAQPSRPPSKSPANSKSSAKPRSSQD